MLSPISVVDSKLSKYQETLTFDKTPVIGSVNPVTSNGISEALGKKVDSSKLAEYQPLLKAGDNLPDVTIGGEDVAAHVSDVTTNPHKVTAQQVGAMVMDAENKVGCNWSLKWDDFENKPDWPEENLNRLSISTNEYGEPVFKIDAECDHGGARLSANELMLYQKDPQHAVRIYVNVTDQCWISIRRMDGSTDYFALPSEDLGEEGLHGAHTLALRSDVQSLRSELSYTLSSSYGQYLQDRSVNRMYGDFFFDLTFPDPVDGKARDFICWFADGLTADQSISLPPEVELVASSPDVWGKYPKDGTPFLMSFTEIEPNKFLVSRIDLPKKEVQ